jgi:hypothetical protein
MTRSSLAETAVKKHTHQVERAIVNSGHRRAIDRVVINLAPERLSAGKIIPFCVYVPT